MIAVSNSVPSIHLPPHVKLYGLNSIFQIADIYVGAFIDHIFQT